MTTTPDYEGICEKLEASFEGAFGELINPDGPEAAQAIRTLMGEKAELRADLTFIAGFAQMRSTDDSRIFARVCRGALRNIAERAKSALTGRGA